MTAFCYTRSYNKGGVYEYTGSDGKFSMEDVQRNFEDLKKNAGDAVDKAKDSLGNIFGGK